MQISVTTEDIYNGGCHPTDCPVALALQRAGFSWPSVNTWSIGFDTAPQSGTRTFRNTPESVKWFVWNYDNRDRPVRPFTFTLPV